MNKRKFNFLLTAFLVFPGTASAYVDPGTGAYLLQLLIAIFGAAVFYISRPAQLFRLIIDFFCKKNKNKK